MRNHLIVVCLLGLVATSCNSNWTEGQSTLSPNKKWFVSLQTKSIDPTNGCARIRIYDTDIYPALKVKPLKADPSGTPTASFTVPVQIYARDAELKWNAASTVLRIEQPELNLKPPIYYAVDLTTFSFSKVEK